MADAIVPPQTTGENQAIANQITAAAREGNIFAATMQLVQIQISKDGKASNLRGN